MNSVHWKIGIAAARGVLGAPANAIKCDDETGTPNRNNAALNSPDVKYPSEMQAYTRKMRHSSARMHGTAETS